MGAEAARMLEMCLHRVRELAHGVEGEVIFLGKAHPLQRLIDTALAGDEFGEVRELLRRWDLLLKVARKHREEELGNAREIEAWITERLAMRAEPVK